jgi:sulfate adenylyltransferase
MGDPVVPHGGHLVNRVLNEEEASAALLRARGLRKVRLDERELSDLEMIAVGAYSPLDGFLDRGSYLSVLKDKTLRSGVPWTIPITLSLTEEHAWGIKAGEEVALVDDGDRPLALMEVRDRYRPNVKLESLEVYRTRDDKHPGVAYLHRRGDTLLAGPVSLVRRPVHSDFLDYRLDPADTRIAFRERGWKTVVGFQTRNPIHRAHEYIQKCAMEIVDGLFLNPIVGFTRSTDVPTALRMKCYKAVIELYYPRERVVLGVLETAMRYAGPMEAIFHAIVRKNFGCTHFIVGRDHAGVGDYYGTYDAQHIFGEFDAEELGISPLFFDHAFYCKRCGGMATSKTCPHPWDSHIELSGTQVRALLAAGERLPPELTRPEVADILSTAWSRGTAPPDGD